MENLEKKIEAIIKDFYKEMPAIAPKKVLEDIDNCYRDILNKHLSEDAKK